MRPRSSQPTAGQPAGFQRGYLIESEGPLEQIARFVIAAEQVDDEVQPFGQVGPIDGAGFARAVGCRVNPLEQGAQIGVCKLLERGGKLGAQIVAQPQPPAMRQADRHHVLGDDQARLLPRDHDEHVDRRVERRRPAEQPHEEQPQAGQPATVGENGLDQAARELLGIDKRGVERFRNFRLQARLLVKPDFDVGQQQELGARLGVAFEERLIDTGESLAQVALTVGRVAGTQFVAEASDLADVKRHVVQACREKAGKLVPDLLEHLLVAPAHRVTRAIDHRGGVQHIPDGFLNLAGVALRADALRGCGDVPGGLRRRRRRVKRIFQRPREILFANRLPGLPGGPGRERAPVRAGAGSLRERRRQLVVALRDLQVADHRIAERRDPIDFSDGGNCVNHGIFRPHRRSRPPPSCAERLYAATNTRSTSSGSSIKTKWLTW